MSANPTRRRLYDLGEAGSRSRSVDSTVRVEGSMKDCISTHYDPYHSPTSPVGMVRADRPKYLGYDYRSRSRWEATEEKDPSSDMVIDPAHETEAAQLLLAYYEAVRRDRIVCKASLPLAFFGIGGIGILLGWLLHNIMVGAVGAALGVFIAYLILNGGFPLPMKTGAARRALDRSGYFQDRSILDGYLITTHSQEVIWEAVDLERRRRAVDLLAVRLGSHLHLPEHRKIEITELQHQEQELRRQIVEILDPQRTDTAHLFDEVRDNFGARFNFGRLSAESTRMMWGEGGEQR